MRFFSEDFFSGFFFRIPYNRVIEEEEITERILYFLNAWREIETENTIQIFFEVRRAPMC